jgi:hypothetical protein
MGTLVLIGLTLRPMGTRCLTLRQMGTRCLTLRQMGTSTEKGSQTLLQLTNCCLKKTENLTNTSGETGLSRDWRLLLHTRNSSREGACACACACVCVFPIQILLICNCWLSTVIKTKTKFTLHSGAKLLFYLLGINLEKAVGLCCSNT